MQENKEELPKPILLEDLGMMYPTENSKERKRFGIYKCGFCGNNFKAITNDINRGDTKSCGCYMKRRSSETHKTHGLRNTGLYVTWRNIKDRTLNIKTRQFPDYGGRGISICEGWENDFMTFYNWAMENGYEENKGLSIDRIDNDGKYCPENCRWTTGTIQSRNQRMPKNNTSGYKGVCFKKDKNKYVAQIGIKPKRIHLGSFKTAEDGAVAYNNYIIANDLEGFPLNKLSDSHIHFQLPTKSHHQTLE